MLLIYLILFICLFIVNNPSIWCYLFICLFYFIFILSYKNSFPFLGLKHFHKLFWNFGQDKAIHQRRVELCEDAFVCLVMADLWEKERKHRATKIYQSFISSAAEQMKLQDFFFDLMALYVNNLPLEIQTRYRAHSGVRRDGRRDVLVRNWT